MFSEQLGTPKGIRADAYLTGACNLGLICPGRQIYKLVLAVYLEKCPDKGPRIPQADVSNLFGVKKSFIEE